MKREWLKELGLTEEQVDKVMAENGKDIEKAKGDLSAKETELEAKTKEAEALQGQLTTANKQIEAFKGMDIEGIKAAADDYKSKYETAKENAEKEIESLKFDYAVENALIKAGAKSAKAAKALLKLEDLKDSKNQDKDIDTAIADLKDSDGYLFQDQDPDGTGGSKGAGAKGKPGTDKNPWSKEHFNLTEQMKLYREDPEKAKTLMAVAKE